MIFDTLFPAPPNAVATTSLLLRKLSIKVSLPTLRSALETHPDFPSLLAVSDCLSKFGVENHAYQIDKETLEISEIRLPSMVHMNIGGGNFFIINQIKENDVCFFNGVGREKVMPLTDFLGQWSGVTLEAIKTIDSGESAYYKNVFLGFLDRLKIPFVVVSVLFLIIFGLGYNKPMFTQMLLLLKLVGISTSVLLLMHSIDANNPLIQNLCSLGKKNNCNDILKSDAAKIFDGLSWSEIGFFYFTGSFLSLFFLQDVIPIIMWLNVLALPYTIWSLVYQYRHKAWCMLCCTVQAVLIFEFVTGILMGRTTYVEFSSIYATNVIKLGLFFLMPIAVWYSLKPVFQKANETSPLKLQLNKFKYNTSLFNQALTNQPRYAVPKAIMPLTIGNVGAETTITIVSNPFCNPCGKAHQKLDELLKSRDDIKLQIVFTTADHEDDGKTKVARHISSLALTEGALIAEQALSSWFAQQNKKYEDWAKQYPVELNETVLEVTKNQKAWCEMVDISFTPTIMVNGYKLPDPYKLDDIPYLIN